MTDLISREAVCKIVADRVTDKFEKKAACHGIRALPAALAEIDTLRAKLAELQFDRDNTRAKLEVKKHELTRALLAAQVKVKPLAWVKYQSANMWRCETVVGTYEVRQDGSWIALWFSGSRISGALPTIDAAKAAAQADYEARILATLDLSPAAVDASQTTIGPVEQVSGERVRHVKRGSTYRVVGRGAIQTDTHLDDYDEVVIYQGEADGKLWARPVSEFEDGRFAAIPVDASQTPDPVVNDPRVKALVEALRRCIVFADGIAEAAEIDMDETECVVHIAGTDHEIAHMSWTEAQNLARAALRAIGGEA